MPEVLVWSVRRMLVLLAGRSETMVALTAASQRLLGISNFLKDSSAGAGSHSGTHVTCNFHVTFCNSAGARSRQGNVFLHVLLLDFLKGNESLSPQTRRYDEQVKSGTQQAAEAPGALASLEELQIDEMLLQAAEHQTLNSQISTTQQFYKSVGLVGHFIQQKHQWKVRLHGWGWKVEALVKVKHNKMC